MSNSELPGFNTQPQIGRILKVAVRDLVEFVFQSGDLRSTFVGSGRALAGTRGHQKIQKSRPSNYQAEIPVSFLYPTSFLSLEIRGRLDGVWKEKNLVILEEIKTTTLSLVEITRDNQPLHWAQAKVYAYIYAVQNSLERIGVQLTYLQLDSQEILKLFSEFTFQEVEQFFLDLVFHYLEWAKKIQEWHGVRDSSIGSLAFPFLNYREGQRKLAIAVYRAIVEGRNLFAQAPTGIGKTVATIFPSLKALGEGKIAKIFYLTAKTVGRGVAEQTLESLAQKGLRCKVLTLTAKEKICFLDKLDCCPEICQFANGHFDRVKMAAMAIFANDRFDRGAIEKVARSYKVCPFEFSLFLSLWADVIICDYNYSFDPRVYLRRFFDPVAENYVFLVDEAHNMPDRAREMYSAELLKSEFSDLRKKVKIAFPSIARSIGRITSAFNHLSKEPSENSETTREKIIGLDKSNLKPEKGANWVIREPPKDLLKAIRGFQKLAEEILTRSEPSPQRDSLLDAFFKVNSFAQVSETFDQNFVCYFERIFAERSKTTRRVPDVSLTDMRVKILCLDPTPLLKTAIKRSRSAVFFSATLLPMSYFFQILGGNPVDWKIILASPFSSNQLELIVIPQIRTEFRFREKSYESIVEIIRTAVSTHTGNYLVYFPSYKYMTSVKEQFAAKYPEWETLEQKSGMTEEARDEFLKKFSPDNRETLIGFVVMGGIFGEGIDLFGERLIGSIVVGVGLPQICLERDLIRDYFQRKSGTGFEFAYRYPGMIRVMQAAGRVIRTEQDYGIVILIDERFIQPYYRKLFPNEWSHYQTILGKERDQYFSWGPAWKTYCKALQQNLDNFWKNRGKPEIQKSKVKG